MKEGSEGEGGGSRDDIPTSRDADSTVSNGGINGPRMGIAPAALAIHEGIPLGGTTLANALLGIALERGSTNGANSSNGDALLGIHSTKTIGVKGIGDNGQNRDKVFMCNICNRSFGYKHVLQNHERTHTGEKPFECKECHKRFTRDHHLKTHMRLHTGEKPYHCSHCERQFVQVANLRRHLRVHTGERPYACHLCSSRFSDSNQLKAHLLIHEGVKPFQCPDCNGRFRRRHHLVHHKCPKDEANIGKPKRGRRPKAYDELPTMLPTIKQEHMSPMRQEHLTAMKQEHMSPMRQEHLTAMKQEHLSAVMQEHLSAVKQERLSAPVSDMHPPPPPPPIAVNLTSVIKRGSSPPPIPQPAHMQQARSGQQHSLQYPIMGLQNTNGGSRFHDTMQTGPLDMTVSTASATVSVITHAAFHVRPGSNSSVEGVLDLSNSRSDSEAEPIEEEVDEEDDCVDDGIDSESDEESRQERLRWIACSWKRVDSNQYLACPWKREDNNQFKHVVMIDHGNGDRYDSEGENSNLALQLTTS